LTLGVLTAVAASSSNSDDIGAGVIAFLIVAAMGVALVFLLRSMNKQFQKIEPPPDTGDGQDAAQDPKTPAETPN
jgi:hypothetical protein